MWQNKCLLNSKWEHCWTVKICPVVRASQVWWWAIKGQLPPPSQFSCSLNPPQAELSVHDQPVTHKREGSTKLQADFKGALIEVTRRELSIVRVSYNSNKQSSLKNDVCIPLQHSTHQVSVENIKVPPTPHTINEEEKNPQDLFFLYKLILFIKKCHSLKSFPLHFCIYSRQERNRFMILFCDLLPAGKEEVDAEKEIRQFLCQCSHPALAMQPNGLMGKCPEALCVREQTRLSIDTHTDAATSLKWAGLSHWAHLRTWAHPWVQLCGQTPWAATAAKSFPWSFSSSGSSELTAQVS